jgi:hypothetical protein
MTEPSSSAAADANAPKMPPLLRPEGRRALWDYIMQQRKLGAPAEAEEMLFLGMCLARYSSSSAQVMQDLYVLWKLRQRRKGYFVEFGAMDGLQISNTALLEVDFDWTGILAEPHDPRRAPSALARGFAPESARRYRPSRRRWRVRDAGVVLSAPRPARAVGRR